MSVDLASPSLKSMKYRVVRSLGVGAGSTILLVAETEGARQFALKVVKKQQASDVIYLDQAKTEYEVAQRINHPNLLKVYDLRVRKNWFKTTGVELLMEYVDGRTLDEYESLSLGNLILVFTKVAAGLEHMHRRGVYHGDLKPGNIMLSRGGAVKIIDFGTARIRGEQKDRVQGTLQYMAPEQASQKLVNDRTDIYNFGATMYRLLTGHHANAGGLPHELGGHLASLSRPKPPRQYNQNVPKGLSELVMACIENDFSERPDSIHAVRERLGEIAARLGLDPGETRLAVEGRD